MDLQPIFSEEEAGEPPVWYKKPASEWPADFYRLVNSDYPLGILLECGYSLGRLIGLPEVKTPYTVLSQETSEDGTTTRIVRSGKLTITSISRPPSARALRAFAATLNDALVNSRERILSGQASSVCTDEEG